MMRRFWRTYRSLTDALLCPVCWRRLRCPLSGAVRFTGTMQLHCLCGLGAVRVRGSV